MPKEARISKNPPGAMPFGCVFNEKWTKRRIISSKVYRGMIDSRHKKFQAQENPLGLICRGAGGLSPAEDEEIVQAELEA